MQIHPLSLHSPSVLKLVILLLLLTETQTGSGRIPNLSERNRIDRRTNPTSRTIPQRFQRQERLAVHHLPLALQIIIHTSTCYLIACDCSRAFCSLSHGFFFRELFFLQKAEQQTTRFHCFSQINDLPSTTLSRHLFHSPIHPIPSPPSIYNNHLQNESTTRTTTTNQSQ